jgi:hypothetical protein
VTNTFPIHSSCASPQPQERRSDLLTMSAPFGFAHILRQKYPSLVLGVVVKDGLRVAAKVIQFSRISRLFLW